MAITAVLKLRALENHFFNHEKHGTGIEPDTNLLLALFTTSKSHYFATLVQRCILPLCIFYIFFFLILLDI